MDDAQETSKVFATVRVPTTLLYGLVVYKFSCTTAVMWKSHELGLIKSYVDVSLARLSL